jgi:anti-sigma factor RsiW
VNCQNAQTFIHGYLDDQLALRESLEIEQHIADCPACMQVLVGLRALRARIKQSALHFPSPPGLSIRVRSCLRTANPPQQTRRLRAASLLAVAASIALIATASWLLTRVLPGRSDDPFLTHELVASHVRSQMLPSHRFDVASSDSHTVKPWFEGKLDFSPPVRDLSAQGFPLLGGRLDYLHNRSVAAIVYQRRNHFINLFIWPSAPGDESAPGKATQQGFHLVQWRTAGMTFWAVSDLNEGELQEFVRMIQG